MPSASEPLDARANAIAIAREFRRLAMTLYAEEFREIGPGARRGATIAGVLETAVERIDDVAEACVAASTRHAPLEVPAALRDLTAYATRQRSWAKITAPPVRWHQHRRPIVRAPGVAATRTLS